jgi:hypothetical protein
MGKNKFDLHKLVLMLDNCEDELKVALEYMEEHKPELERDYELYSIMGFLEKFVRNGGILDLQKINFMLYLKEHIEELKTKEIEKKEMNK